MTEAGSNFLRFLRARVWISWLLQMEEPQLTHIGLELGLRSGLAKPTLELFSARKRGSRGRWSNGPRAEA